MHFSFICLPFMWVKVSANAFIYISIYLFIILFFITATTFKWKKSFEVRILITVWILGVLILSNSYSGCFYSILAIPEFELPIDTIADIQKISQSDRGYIITLTDSSYLQMFLTSVKEGGIFHLIGQHMNRYALRWGKGKTETLSFRTRQKMVAMDEEAVRAVEQRERITLIASRLYLATIRYVYSRKQLHLARDILSLDFVSFIFSKKSPLEKLFSMM